MLFFKIILFLAANFLSPCMYGMDDCQIKDNGYGHYYDDELDNEVADAFNHLSCNSPQAEDKVCLEFLIGLGSKRRGTHSRNSNECKHDVSPLVQLKPIREMMKISSDEKNCTTSNCKRKNRSMDVDDKYSESFERSCSSTELYVFNKNKKYNKDDHASHSSNGFYADMLRDK